MNQRSDLATATFRVEGMTCASCEILLERTLKSLPGVLSAKLHHRTGKATITALAANPPDTAAIAAAIRAAGYAMEGDERPAGHGPQTPSQRSWLEIGASLVIIFALWKILSAFGIFELAPATSSAVSFTGALIIGLVAGTSSCLAVTGGLLLAVAAKYNDARESATPWQKFVPLLQFNVGRLTSYFLLGGVVGLLGQSITLSARMTGFLNIAIALVMLSLALSILQILPRQSVIRPPKALSHWIHGFAERGGPLAPVLLGAFTFFLPCGFTQSLQLVALASGSFTSGAVTMFAFALGTLPALLGISALSSWAKGQSSRLFLTFSGSLVLVLSLYNLNNALAASGMDLASLIRPASPSQPKGGAPAVVGGVQEVSMRVLPFAFEPNQLTVKAGVPVRWTVDGTNASGCTSVLIIPSLNITKPLASGPSVIEFTPPKPGRLAFSCSMGMVRGAFNVL